MEREALISGRCRATALVLYGLALGFAPGVTGSSAAAAEEASAGPAREIVEALLEDRYHDAYQRALQTAKKARPGARILALLGLAEVKIGRYRSGEASLRRAVRLEPESSEGHLGLGLLALGRTDLEVAARHFRTATRSRRLFDEAFYALRATRLDQGDLVGAKRALRDHQARLESEGRELPARLVAGREHLDLCAAERVSRAAPGFERIVVELADRRGAGGATCTA